MFTQSLVSQSDQDDPPDPTTKTGTTTTPAPEPEPEMCACDCEYMEKINYFSNSFNSYENKSQEDLIEILQEKLDQVTGQLEVEKTEIPAVKARKVSAPDSRPSARNVGMIAVTFMAFVFGGIILLDLLSLPRYIRTVRENLC